MQVATTPTGTKLTVSTSAPFAETAYRPSPKLLLVDLHNVSLAKEKPLVPLAHGPVTSYRIYSYHGSDNEQVVRMEIGLNASAQPHVQVRGNELIIEVSGSGSQVKAAPATTAVARTAKLVAPKPSMPVHDASHDTLGHEEGAQSTGHNRLVGVHVDASNRGVVVLLHTSGEVLKWNIFPLHHPERMVIDLAGLTKAVSQAHWAIDQNGVKEVRVGQFSPSVVRIVLDLTHSLDPVIGKTGDGLRIVLPAAPSLTSSAARPSTGLKPIHFAWHEAPRAASVYSRVHLTRFEVPAAPASVPMRLAAKDPVTPSALAEVATTHPAPSIASAAQPARGDPPVTVGVPSAVPAPAPSAPVPVSSTLTRQASLPSQNPSTSTTPRGEAPPSLLHPLQSQVTATGNAVPYSGQRISLNLKDADIKDFFRLIHEISGLNLVIDPNVQGTVTMVLNDIPWDQALDLVLRNNQLGRQLEGNVVRIATVKTLQKEASEQADLQKAQEAAVPLQTEVKALSYAKASDMVTPLKQFLGSRDNITPDPRTNTLLIQATPDKLPLLNQLIARLDQKTPQVEVEARVVAASRNFSRELGVQLGFAAANRTTAVGGVPSVGSSPTTAQGLTPQYPTTAGSIPFNVNLGATAPTSGLGFITATNSYRIDALLSAAEQKGLGHVLSRPKVITQNNAQAIVQQGVKIPVQTTINNTISVQFFNVTLRLAVTPQITADNTVFLQVDIENDQIDPGIPAFRAFRRSIRSRPPPTCWCRMAQPWSSAE